MTYQLDENQQLYTVKMIAEKLKVSEFTVYNYIKDLGMSPATTIKNHLNKDVRLYNEVQVDQLRKERSRKEKNAREARQRSAAKARKARSLQAQDQQINDDLVDTYGSEGKGHVVCKECDHFWMPYAYTRSENGDTELFMIYCAKCLKQRTFEE